jgi:hypothetical protein
MGGGEGQSDAGERRQLKGTAIPPAQRAVSLFYFHIRAPLRLDPIAARSRTCGMALITRYVLAESDLDVKKS